MGLTFDRVRLIAERAASKDGPPSSAASRMSLPETITNKGEGSRNRFRESLPGKESLLDLTHRRDTVAEVRVKYPRTLKRPEPSGEANAPG